MRSSSVSLLVALARRWSGAALFVVLVVASPWLVFHNLGRNPRPWHDEGEALSIPRAIAAQLDAKGWRLTHILNTHHHGDHAGGNLELKERTGCTIVGPRADVARIPGIDVARPAIHEGVTLHGRHETHEVLDVERRTSVFHNAPRPVLSSIEQDASRQRELKALIHMDGHEHAAHRALTSEWFKPSSIGRMMPRLDSLSARVLTTLEELGGECEWVSDIALPYPLQVILEVLGLPESDYPRMLRLTQELFGQEDADLQREPQSPEAREKVVEDFFTYFRSLATDRRTHPRDDLASVIANAVIDGQPIEEWDASPGFFLKFFEIPAGRLQGTGWAQLTM